MDGVHLRLEAIRVDGALYGPEGMDEGGGARPTTGLMLDRRAASLRFAANPGAALLGYALLPWCDVTLWSEIAAADVGTSVDARVGLRGAGCGEERALAWMRVDIEHIDWALSYVERLPVERALVAKAWRWRWSSAAWHCGFGGKPGALAPEWSGPLRRDLWRDRLAGAFVGRSDRSVPVPIDAARSAGPRPQIVGSALDRLSLRWAGHSPGMPSPGLPGAPEMDPSQGELAVA